jgi:hypothetical protein
VLVGVDEPRGEQAAAAVDQAAGGATRRAAGADRGDPVALDDDVPAGVLGARCVR